MLAIDFAVEELENLEAPGWRTWLGAAAAVAVFGGGAYVGYGVATGAIVIT